MGASHGFAQNNARALSMRTRSSFEDFLICKYIPVYSKPPENNKKSKAVVYSTDICWILDRHVEIEVENGFPVISVMFDMFKGYPLWKKNL